MEPCDIIPSVKKFSVSLGRQDMHILNEFSHNCLGLIKVTLKTEVADIRMARREREMRLKSGKPSGNI